MAILVTGSAGFIGSNLVRHLRRRWPDTDLISLDALTYAGHLASLRELEDDPGHLFVRGDITDRDLVRSLFEQHDITGVMHLAAESHVDRSIVEPLRFVQTNVVGTMVLLDEAQRAWERRDGVRFHHVSTDEVFGDLGPDGLFSESTPYRPHSPYAASKASSDHFVRSWYHTYGFPTVITNCTNNYGPFQYPEKLIPLTIARALAMRPVPLYGEGLNVRDWLYVEDHCDAIARVFEQGKLGETYCVGGQSETKNVDLVGMVLDEVDRMTGRDIGTGRGLVQFVADRPGHDRRYAMDISRIDSELGWQPSVPLPEGLRRTVEWYIANQDWCAEVTNEEHLRFEAGWYSDRGGA